MDHFHFRDGELYVEDLAVAGIVERHGSPLYIYSARTFEHHVAAMRAAFAALDPLLCFSVKSCANLSILKLLVEQGCGLDVVSGGELYRALQAGADAGKIVFAGVGKSREELADAIKAGVFLFNVESEAELARLDALACAAGKRIKAAIRVNPDVADPGTHHKTATGGRQTKFGVPIAAASALFTPGRYPSVDVVGVHVHLGSPILSAQTYLAAIDKVEQFVDQLEADGAPVNWINIGGGFPAPYYADAEAEAAPADTLAAMGRAICARLAPLQARCKRFIIEPGRAISANAGILVTRVEYVKQGWDRKIVVADAGMNVLLRPALYGAGHVIWPVRAGRFSGHWSLAARAAATPAERVDVVGPICETGDYFALDRPLPALQSGELLALFSCGAYGMSMANQYNSRGRPAEVLVENGRARLVRRRESHADLVAHELCALDEVDGFIVPMAPR
ncbi:MAG: diaminopimelate decarboxylase [Pseudomonadota bacterium]